MAPLPPTRPDPELYHLVLVRAGASGCLILCSSFPVFLKYNLRSLILDLSSFQIYTLRAVSFPPNNALAASHDFEYAMYSLFLSLKYFLIYLLINSFILYYLEMHCLISKYFF